MAMRGLIDNASGHEHQIAMLWQAVSTLQASRPDASCVPGDATLSEHFEAAKLNDLVGK
jgi:serine O-acetyltransferase